MTIITADDEPLALEMLTDLVKTVKPEAEVIGFSRPQKIVEWIKTNKADVAFLDIRMRGMTGLELAEKIYERHTILTEALIGIGVSSDVAQQDACKMEHIISDETFEAFKKHMAK